MEAISIDFDIPGLEISTENRWAIVQTIENALQDTSGQWTGCQYTEDTITIHAVVDDQEQSRSLIRSAIKGHSVFSHNFTKAMIDSHNCLNLNMKELKWQKQKD